MTDQVIRVDDIKVHAGHTQGYGGPGTYWVSLTWENVLLDAATCYSEREAGKAEALFLQRWKQHDWQPAEWAVAIEGKPQASKPCSHCGLDTLDGGSSQYDRYWCKRPACQKDQADYGVLQQAKSAEWLADSERKEAKRKAAELAKRDEARTGFHWKDWWFFKRMDDGSVRVSHADDRPYVNVQFSIPAPEWASIVCSVSAGGETGERWEASQDFHGRSPSSAGLKP